MAKPDTDQDLKDLLTEEIVAVDDALAAPTRPFVRNFEQQTEIENVREKLDKAAAATVNAAAAKPSNISGFSLKN